MRRTLHPRRRLGPVNQAVETTSGTSRSETPTSTSREERRPDRSYGLLNLRVCLQVTPWVPQGVRMNHSEQNREERPGRFLTSREPTEQQVKMFKQVRAPPAHVKE